jgi:flagellar basal-body rod protein FlgB
MPQNLFSSAVDVLQKNLDLRQQRHSVLSANIANAETPGFIAKDVQFEESLRAALHSSSEGPLQRSHPRHLPPPSPSVQEVQGRLVARPSDDVGRDLNSVSVDQEMAALTTNDFHYNASAEMLSRLFSSLRRTINEGRS